MLLLALPAAKLARLTVDRKFQCKECGAILIAHAIERVMNAIDSAGDVPSLFVDAGDYSLEARGVRYWVVMKVVYEPGQPIVLASMWAGLAGMIITFVGRMRRRK